MKNYNETHVYANELANSITHGIGTLLSIVGLIFLVVLSSLHYDVWHIVSFSIFGVSMTVLYASSTLYHSFRQENIKRVLQKVDHAAIYFLIAGSYTPFTLVTLNGVWGWTLFGVVWAFALVGFIIQIFFRLEKMKLVSSIIYLVMGWMAMIVVKPLFNALPTNGLLWLLAGGLFYSFGVIFYLWKNLPFNHGIWHLFVLGGSICHFCAIYFYV